MKTLHTEIEEEMKERSIEALQMNYLSKSNAVFRRTAGGFVSLELSGKVYDRVDFYRTFPFTDPNVYISVREIGEKKKEIGMIKDLEQDVDEDTSSMIKEQLDIRYFIPTVLKVYDVKSEYGYAYFHVKTNSGTCKFTVFSNGGGVISLSATRVLITDIDGNRYEIPDINQLSAKELKKLDLFL